MTDRLKVAILGGSFNPVTLGHLQCARYIINNTDVQQVWLTPCFSHIWNKELLSPNHRYVMCLLATEINDGVIAFNFEISKKITTGTFDFLSLLLVRYPEIDFSYIIGMDNANQFNKWARAPELKEMVRFIVVSRQGISQNEDGLWYTRSPHIFLNAEEEIMNISSTIVRGLIKDNQTEDLNKYLHPRVLKYIQDQGLYRHEEVQEGSQ